MTIAIVLAVVLVGLLSFALTRPESINIQRASDMKAPADRIFAFINDFHEWPKWAPQDKSDSTMMRSFDGPASGKGAASDWASRGRAGTGRMEITESNAPFHVTVKVEFVKPFRACNINSFALEPIGDMTRVTWSMRGPNPFIARVMSVFVDMNQVMGRHFETGLKTLKALSEA